ncbi:MAG: hypothetical protein R3C11_29115 [Planctomycetaceae bacterium]
MSVRNLKGTKVVLPRLGVDQLWDDMRQHYAARNQIKWRHFAMLTLAELGNWPIENIACAMGHSPGHISRCITKVKSELRETFGDPFFEKEPELPPRNDPGKDPCESTQRSIRSAFD